MPRFHYIAKNARGQTVNAFLEAYDKISLIRQLQRQGLFVVKVEPAPLKKAVDAAPPAEQKFTHNNIKLSDLVGFCRQLCTMLEAGVTLLRSLDVITSQVESKGLYKILRQVTADVEQGSSLSLALSRHPKVFTPFWISLVEVGEASGTLPRVLNKLAEYLEQEARFRSTVTSAVIYPAVLFFICCGAIVFFATFVGPRFETVFKSMNVELPWITKVLLATFKFIKHNLLWILFGAVLLFISFKKWKQTQSGRRQWEQFLLSLPTFGNIYKLIIIERFTSQMAILVESGVPILQALDISTRLVDNITCAKIIEEIKEAVRQGDLLAAPMARSNFFPPLCVQMITVGEETGELSKMLGHVAAYYQETVETFMKRFGTLIEPFMLVFMGAVIGTIVLAMFLPMFNIVKLGGVGG